MLEEIQLKTISNIRKKFLLVVLLFEVNNLNTCLLGFHYISTPATTLHDKKKGELEKMH